MNLLCFHPRPIQLKIMVLGALNNIIKYHTVICHQYIVFWLHPIYLISWWADEIHMLVILMKWSIDNEKNR